MSRRGSSTGTARRGRHSMNRSKSKKIERKQGVKTFITLVLVLAMSAARPAKTQAANGVNPQGYSGITYSAPAKLTVNTPRIGDIMPTGKDVNMFAKKTFSASLGSSGSSEWQIWKNNKWETVQENADWHVQAAADLKSTSLTITANDYSMNNGKYRVIAYGAIMPDTGLPEETTKEFTLKINQLHNTISKDLGNVTAIEGGSAEYAIAGTFANSKADDPADTRYPGNPAYAWEYRLPDSVEGSDGNWHDIFDENGESVLFYTKNSDPEKLLLEKPDGIEYRDYEITRFEKLRYSSWESTEYNGTLYRYTDSPVVKIRNARHGSCEGIQVRVTLRTFNDGIVGITSRESVLSVIQEDFIALRSFPSGKQKDIGSELYPDSDFINMVDYNNGETKRYSGPMLRFWSPSEGEPTIENAEDMIRTRVAGLMPEQEETSAFLASNHLLKNSGIEIEGKTYEYIYAPAEGEYYIASKWEEASGAREYWYTKLTPSMIGNEDEQGLLTSDRHVVKDGTNKAVIILPSSKDITRTVAAEVEFEGGDYGAPVISRPDAYLNAIAPENMIPADMPLLKEATVWLVAEAEDNVTPPEKIKYQWLKDGAVYGPEKEGPEGLVLELNGPEKCNGEWRLQAEDEAGNKRASEFRIIDIWDTEPPMAEVSFEPDIDASAKKITLRISAQDPHPSDRPYALTSGEEPPAVDSPEWTSDNVLSITSNGTYYLYVKDTAGNILEWKDENGERMINVSSIDTDPPYIEKTEVSAQQNEDGSVSEYDDESGEKKSYIKVSVTATDVNDAGIDLTPDIQYRLGRDLNFNGRLDDDEPGEILADWQEPGVFENLPAEGIYLAEARDQAYPEGNVSRKKTSIIDEEMVSGKLAKKTDPDASPEENLGILEEKFDAGLDITPRTWTSSGVKIRINIGKNRLKLAESPYSFDGGETFQMSSEYDVWENGEYRPAFRDMYGNIYHLGSAEINWIDTGVPSAAAERNDRGCIIHVEGTDDGSGILRLVSSQMLPDGSWLPEKTITVAASGEAEVSADFPVPEKGIYKFAAYDMAGNRTETEEIDCMDAYTANRYIGPDADLSGWIRLTPSGWTNNGARLTLAVPDTEGFAEKPYQWRTASENEEENTPADSQWAASPSIEVPENGEYIVYVRDMYGNVFTGRKTVSNIDATNPETAWEDGGAFARAGEGIDKNKVTIRAKDAISGIAKFTVTIDGDEQVVASFTGNKTEASYMWNVPQKYKDYIFRVYDNAGNYLEHTIESETFDDIFTDNECLGEDDLTGYIRTEPEGWTNGNATLTVELPDTRYLAENPYSWDGGEYSMERSVTAETNGTHLLKIKDMYGNEYEARINVSNIDKTKPGISEPDFGAAGSWADITVSDTQSGLAMLEAAECGDSNEPQEWSVVTEWSLPGTLSKTVRYTFPENGTYMFRLTDHAGNISETVQAEVIDARADNPCLINAPGGVLNAYITSSPENWTKENVTLTLSLPSTEGLAGEPYLWREIETNKNEDGSLLRGEDGNPELKETAGGDLVYKRIDGYGDNGTGPFTREYRVQVHENGVYEVLVRDSYGHEYSGRITVDNIDRNAPGITALPNEQKNTVSLSASDAQSGILKITVSRNNGPEQDAAVPAGNTGKTFTAQYKIPANGNYVFTAYDKAGNKSAGAEVTIEGAITGNQLLAGDISAYIQTSPNGWTNSKITLTAAFPSTEGFAVKPYSWDGGEFGASPSYAADKNGTHTLAVKDIYENIYTGYVQVGNIDKTAPELRISEDGGTIMAVAGDAASGLSRIKIEKVSDGGTVPAYEEAFEKNAAGTGSMTGAAVYRAKEPGAYRVTAYDAAGNASAQRALEVVPEDSKPGGYASDSFTGPGIASRLWLKPYTWTNRDVSLVLTLSENDRSALADNGCVKYTWDEDGNILSWPEGDTEYTVETEHALHHNGGAYVTLLAKDMRRYKSDTIEISNIDREAPKTTATPYLKYIDYYDWMSDSPSMQRAQVTLYRVTASDTLSGIRCVKTDGHMSAVYPDPLEKEAQISFMPAYEGNHYVEAADHAGNTSRADIRLDVDQRQYILSEEGLTSSVYYEELDLTAKKAVLATDLDIKDAEGNPLLDIEWLGPDGSVICDGRRCVITENMDVRMRVTYDGGQGRHSEVSSAFHIGFIDREPPLLAAATSSADTSVLMIQVKDAGSGVAEIIVACPDGASRRIAAYKNKTADAFITFKCPSDGEYAVTAYDRAGNKVTETVTATVLKEASYEADYGELFKRSVIVAPESWTNGNVVVRIALPSVKGLAADPYSFDGGQTWGQDSAAAYRDNCDAKVALKDAAGNEYHISIPITCIDRTLPELGVSLTGGEAYERVSISAMDSESGIDTLIISGGPYGNGSLLSTHGGRTEAVMNINIDEEGAYTVKARDMAGNEKTAEFTVSGLVKSLPPVITTKTVTKTQTETQTETQTIADYVTQLLNKKETVTEEVPYDRIIEKDGPTEYISTPPVQKVVETHAIDDAVKARLDEIQSSLLDTTMALGKANKMIAGLEKSAPGTSGMPAIYAAGTGAEEYYSGRGLTMNKVNDSTLAKRFEDVRRIYVKLFGESGARIMLPATAGLLLLIIILSCIGIAKTILGGGRDKRKVKP